MFILLPLAQGSYFLESISRGSSLGLLSPPLFLNSLKIHGLAHGMWKFPGQRSNRHRSRHQSHSSGNPDLLTTRPLGNSYSFIKRRNHQEFSDGPVGLRLLRFHCCGSGHCCGTGLIPGLGTSTHCGCGQKEKRKKEREPEINTATLTKKKSGGGGGVPVVAQWLTRLVSMRTWVQSWAPLSRLRIWCCLELWVGHRLGSDPALLWYRLAA